MKQSKKHPKYWKVKAAFLQVQQTTAQAKAAVDAAEATFAKVMADAGLDPAKVVYRLDDATETITPQK